MPPFDSSDTRIGRPVPHRAARRRFELGRMRPADLFDAWMFAEADATLALADWRFAPRAKKSDAHAAYLAALDREAHAAEVLAERVKTALGDRLIHPPDQGRPPSGRMR
jgi:hypothetical protein